MTFPQIQSLVQAAQSGDRQAFGELVAQFSGLVTGVAYSACGDFARSEDIGQEAFFEAWTKLSTLRDPQKFPAWICTIARRRAIDDVRKTQSRSAGALQIEPIDPHSNPEAAMESKQQRELVWSMLERLPETYRESMVLFYRGEQSVSDVALALEENEATIRQRLKRGRELLKTEMTDIISQTIEATAPGSAFASAVVAGLPAFSKVAIAGAATAGKAGSAISSAAATGSLAAILGPAIGILGGVLGTWSSWRSAEYKSQQGFIVRTSIHYLIGTAMFLGLFGILLSVRLGHHLNDRTYGILLLTLIAASMLASGVWIAYVIKTLKRLKTEAEASGEPRRPEIAKRIDQYRDNARVERADGSIGFEAFNWNPGGWFGGSLGGAIWMAIAAALLILQGDWLAGVITLACFAVALFSSVAFYRNRERMRARVAYNWILLILLGLTAIVLATFQFLASAASQQVLSWTPWAWLLLLIFPTILLQFYLIQRGAEKELLAAEMDGKP